MAKELKRNQGFDGRMFLTESEWRTYLKRKPVRYVRRKCDSNCTVCGKPAAGDNPLQHSHRIGFDMGVIDLALTPDFLDGPENIATAHRKLCNRSVELSLSQACKRLRELGVQALPEFIPISLSELVHQK